ncbi:hypothetical protein BKA93DRAFT_867035, partial [Sparassis latifolia]
DEMEGIVEMFPLWRDSKRKFNAQNVELFIGRCEELKCPTLALQVFSMVSTCRLLPPPAASSIPCMLSTLYNILSLFPHSSASTSYLSSRPISFLARCSCQHASSMARISLSPSRARWPAR